MVDDHKLADEAGRLAALDRYGVLDSRPEPAFDKITTLVQTILDVPICAVTLIAQDRQWFKSIRGLDATETTRAVSICSHTILTREPLIVPDAMLDSRFVDNPSVTDAPNVRSYAGMPLCTPDGYNLGALCAVDTKPRDFKASQIEILRRFGGIVVDELELRMIAHRDFLTGAMTRMAFVRAAEQEIERLRRYRRPSSLLVFDIDHFKKINDTLGHPMGDQVLKAVAASTDGALRSTDVFGRLGGEEFGIVLPETPLSSAIAMAERLRRHIGALTFVGAPGLRVTASFGVAALDEQQDFDGWMAATDAALYHAKHAGRDCTRASQGRGASVVA